jgi:ribosomal-protein-serine acetyltransferase
MQYLNSGNFVLRAPSEQDAPSIVDSVRESTATVGVWMSWATPNYSHAEAIAWIRACEAGRVANTGYEFGIFTSATGHFVGAAGLNQFNKVNNFCNLGYWVRESAQRQGVATAAVAALRNYAFNGLGLARVEIVAAVNNEPSLSVARRSGATFECTARNRLQLHGKAVDACVFSFIPTPGA